jgi:chitinase
MDITRTASRLVLVAGCAAFVTVGCGGGGSSSPTAPVVGGNGSDNGSSPSPSTPTTTPPATPPTTPPTTPTAHAGHKRCGWIGAADHEFAAGKASFLANPDYYDAIHPKWGTLNPDGSVKILSPMADDADIVTTAHAHHVKLIPLIDYDDAAFLRNAIASPAGVQAHAQMLADLVAKHGWDGVELDYEHLWSAADRAPYLATIAATATLLHAAQKELTLALPAMDHDDKNNAYDYTTLQSTVDVMHLMAYDFHFLGGDHLGPLAPKGWVNDVVTRVQSLGAPGKYRLGVANYGIGSGWYTSAKDAAARCNGGTHAMSTDHMLTCPLSHQEAGLAPHCTTASGDIWFEDTASMTEKAQLAKAHGFGGVGYWTIGDEPDGFYTSMTALFN